MSSTAPLTPRVVERAESRVVAYDHGAHLASWTVRGEPVVWLSERAVLDGSRAIRGGVPICFPWFAAGPDGAHSPSHGPVRTTVWTPDDTLEQEVLAWRLSSADVAGAPGAEHLPGAFELRYAVSLPDASQALSVALQITNPGTDPLRVEAALHTYLAVADVTGTTVTGLDGADYLDKVRGLRRRQDGPVRLDGEIDNVYDSPGTEDLRVEDGQRTIHLHPVGATQTVVWNPGPRAAAEMSDLDDEEWRDFVCVEAAATGARALTIPPGGSHVLACAIVVP